MTFPTDETDKNVRAIGSAWFLQGFEVSPFSLKRFARKKTREFRNPVKVVVIQVDISFHLESVRIIAKVIYHFFIKRASLKKRR